MKKYDKYDNELTKYINLIVGFNISDIIGDIVGDILDVDIPINLTRENTSIDVKTPLGIVTIKFTKDYYQETLYIYRKIGEIVYEEYVVDLNELIVENIVRGLILEKRDKGIILTEITRKYAPCEEKSDSLRLFEIEERKCVYDNHQLYNIGMYLWCFYLETAFNFVKEDYKKYKRLVPKVDTRISMQFPKHGVIGVHGSGFYGRFPLSINGNSFSHLYEDIEKDRKLEIVDDLLHARITSLNIEHLRNMIIWDLDSRNDYRKYQLRGFNLFSTYGFFRSTDNERVGTINDLTQEYIGPSIVTLDKEYYEYLKNLVSSTLQIELSSSKIKEEGLVKLIKSYYSANKNY